MTKLRNTNIVRKSVEYLFLGMLLFYCVRGMHDFFPTFAFGVGVPKIIAIIMAGCLVAFCVADQVSLVDLPVLFLAMGMTRSFAILDGLGGIDYFTICSVLFYICSKHFVYGDVLNRDSDYQNKGRKLLYTFCYGIFAFHIIQAITYFRYYKERIQIEEAWIIKRAWPIYFEYPETMRNVTFYCFVGVMLGALIVYGLYCFAINKSKYALVITVMGIIVVPFYVRRNSRTPFLTTLIIAFINVIMLCIYYRKNIVVFVEKHKKKVIATTICFAIVIVGMGYVIYSSWLSRDGGFIHSARVISALSILKNLPEYKLGGMPKEAMYLAMAHTAWGEAAAMTGWLPFVYLIIFSLFTFVDLIKVLKSDVQLDTKMLLTSLYIAITLYLLVEPTLYHSTMAWMFYCMICGTMSGTLYVAKHRK